MFETGKEQHSKRTDRVWDLLTVGVMLVLAALSFIWFLPAQ